MKYKLKMQKEEVVEAIKKALEELTSLPMILNGHRKMHLEQILTFYIKQLKLRLNLEQQQ